ncbi:MAG TPA: hypothetical protein VGH44_01530 [Candidatus Saccharimonadia bacterium]|jgi:histidinol phosphatase-like PHP family hydrolase
MHDVDRVDRAIIEQYVGGLAHVHTRLSNFPGHHESDQTVGALIDELVRAGLVGDPRSPLQYVMINDHSSNPAWPAPLRMHSLRAQALDRRRWREQVDGVRVLFGFEASLLADGRTDLPWELTEDCELVIASVHVVPDEIDHNAEALQEMFERACANPGVDVIGHPVRHIEGLRGMDWSRILERAAATGTAIEVNMNIYPDPKREPARARFWAEWLRALANSGADVFLGSDIHNRLQRERFVHDWLDLGHPGRSRVADCVGGMMAADIEPERVVNANWRQFRSWLELDKRARAVRARTRATRPETVYPTMALTPRSA